MAIARDHVVDIQGTGEDAAAKIIQLLRRLGPVLHQVFDDQGVGLAACLSNVDQALHLVDVGQNLLELLVKGPQLLEEGRIEDLRRLDGDQDAVVLAELALELLVLERCRVVAVEIALGGVLGPQLWQERAKSHHDHHAARQHGIAMGADEACPAPEGRVDAIA
jgi:hypothetical protein